MTAAAFWPAAIPVIYNYGRDYYCYCWPRDACYALWPLIRLGHFDETRAFFSFARDTLHTSGYLMQISARPRYWLHLASPGCMAKH